MLYPRRHLYPHPRDHQRKAGPTASRGRRAWVPAALRQLTPGQVAGRATATQPAWQRGTWPGATRGDSFIPNRNPCPAALPAAQLTGEQVRPPAPRPLSLAVGPNGPGLTCGADAAGPLPASPSGPREETWPGEGSFSFPSRRTVAGLCPPHGGPVTAILAPSLGPRCGRPRGWGKAEAGTPARRAGGLGCPLSRAPAELVEVKILAPFQRCYAERLPLASVPWTSVWPGPRSTARTGGPDQTRGERGASAARRRRQSWGDRCPRGVTRWPAARTLNRVPSLPLPPAGAARPTAAGLTCKPAPPRRTPTQPGRDASSG